MDIHKKPMENNLLVDESCCQKISIIRSAFVYPMIILYTPTFHVYRLHRRCVGTLTTEIRYLSDVTQKINA